jgi:hypothetical protein
MGQNMGQYTLTGTATPFTLISLHPQFEWEYPRLATYADLDGQYRIEGLRRGSYDVRLNRSATTSGYFTNRSAPVPILFGTNFASHFS